MKFFLLTILLVSSMFLSFNNVITVSDFLLDNYVKDGTISYQKNLQKAIDALPGTGGTVIFPPMIYLIDESGLKIKSNITK